MNVFKTKRLNMPEQNIRKRARILHPFLLAVFPVISLYAYNIDQVLLPPVFLACSATLLCVTVLFFSLSALLRNNEKSGLIVSLLVLFFFSYGHIHSILHNVLVKQLATKAVFDRLNMAARLEIYLHAPLLIFFFIVIFVLVVLIIKSKQAGSSELARVFNGIALVLVTMSLLRIGLYHMKTGRYVTWPKADLPLTLRNLDYKPDIYYIILDGYARADVLKVFYNFENNEFITGLEAEGFTVLDKSFTNYAWTFLSLASSLNFEYVNHLSEIMGPRSIDLRIPYQMINDNRTARLLKSQGYTFVLFSSTWRGTQSSDIADMRICYKEGLFNDEFLRIFSQTSMLKVFDSLIVEDLAATHLYSFEKLSRAHEIKGPKFAFFHMLLPHHPFIFDRDGAIRKHIDMTEQFISSGWANQEEYVDQLIFVNKKTLEAVSSILKNSSAPPVIIIQSDHGPQISRKKFKDFVIARMGNFMAFYLPGEGGRLLYPTMTPVNVFRLVLSHYFSADLPLLEDIAYYSEFNRPYKFLFSFRTSNEVPADSSGAQKPSQQPSAQGRK
jgi:hypothetical protein